eukprot:scaffold33587_cov15-Tisochrysis_lutea.AAC.1
MQGGQSELGCALVQLSSMTLEQQFQQQLLQQQPDSASRPASTASSLWSNYDMDAGTKDLLEGRQ